MNIYKVLTLILSSSLFVACGGGDPKNTSDRLGLKDGVGYGTYVDSAVDGVHYKCGDSITGTTGDTGVVGGFAYKLGESCTFSINGITLTEVLGDSLKSDKVEVKVGNVEVARFLQSLDMDGNPDNDGIKISADVINVLAKNNETQLPSTSADVQRIVNLLSSAGIGYMGEAKTKAQTQIHMAGFSLDISATKVKIFEGEELGLSADITGSSTGLTYNWAGLGKTSQSFTTSDLPVGMHTIVVYVTKGNITFSDSIEIEVIANSEFIINIKSNSTKFNTADDILFRVNATISTGGNLDYSYVWKDGTTVLSSTTNVLIQKFTAGEHSVSVDVTSGDVTKVATFDFNVSDLSDFDISDTTITQKSKNLMWINAPKGTVSNGKTVCLAIHRDDYNATLGYDDSFTGAKTFCRNMTFAGFSNWRTPYVSELTNYVKATNEANIETKYDKPCIQILALNDGVTASGESDGVNYRAVTTRFMTQNYPQVETGILRGHNYSSAYENDPKYNVGLRCVRNTDNSGGEDVVVVGSNIAVSITGAKTNYTDAEDVTLVANVTGATTATTYSWKENGSEIGTVATLVKSDFSIGQHTVNLLVTADDINKSSSVTFSVAQAPDVSDFNLTTLTANNDEVIIQNSTHLMWVNEHTISKGKCAKIHGNDDNHTSRYESEFTSAKTFCSSGLGNFAGFSGWRTPTASELVKFITDTQDIPRGTTPLTTIAYDADCKKLLALKQSDADVDNNDSYTTILTRFSTNPGAESDLQPNIGLRCVRTHSN